MLSLMYSFTLLNSKCTSSALSLVKGSRGSNWHPPYQVALDQNASRVAYRIKPCQVFQLVFYPSNNSMQTASSTWL